jgi:hypothetical protein
MQCTDCPNSVDSHNGRNRREFLADVGMGFTGLALGAMLQRDGIVRADTTERFETPDGRAHFPPRAKRVIWLFLAGGYSHLETFDPKPAINKYAGKSFSAAPFPNPLGSPLLQQRARAVVSNAKVREAVTSQAKIYPMQVGHRKYGESGIFMSDWFPHLATCVDDIAVVRSMYTTDDDHAAAGQIHTGRHKLDETQPSVGAWVHYGLGTLNENLPQFVVLGDFRDTRINQQFQSYYLGPQHNGIRLSLDPADPLPFAKPGNDIDPREQRNEFELIKRLNGLTAVEYPDDEKLRARIRSYELAFRMQTAVPQTLDFGSETAETLRLYGIDQNTTEPLGRACLAARKLSENGVRFVHVYLSRYSEWDSHADLKKNHSAAAARVDRPVAGLLKDLKRRGMLDDTLVVFCTEFGRTPAMETRNGKLTNGRDHHPHGFSIWMAGGGIKPGIVHGATDELGFHAVEHPHYVTDIHATVLRLLGLNSRRLDIPGRKRLDVDYGRPIEQIIA